jgi:hypothetical protein
LKASIVKVAPTTMEAHPSLKLTLLPFQKESLFWMKQQETGPWKGGMLADESEWSFARAQVGFMADEGYLRLQWECEILVADGRLELFTDIACFRFAVCRGKT